MLDCPHRRRGRHTTRFQCEQCGTLTSQPAAEQVAGKVVCSYCQRRSPSLERETSSTELFALAPETEVRPDFTSRLDGDTEALHGTLVTVKGVFVGRDESRVLGRLIEVVNPDGLHRRFRIRASDGEEWVVDELLVLPARVEVVESPFSA